VTPQRVEGSIPRRAILVVIRRWRRYAAPRGRRWQYADDEYGIFELSVDADRIAVDYERLATGLT
jgi:hypothetical protein